MKIAYYNKQDELIKNVEPFIRRQIIIGFKEKGFDYSEDDIKTMLSVVNFRNIEKMLQEEMRLAKRRSKRGRVIKREEKLIRYLCRTAAYTYSEYKDRAENIYVLISIWHRRHRKAKSFCKVYPCMRSIDGHL